MYPRVPGSVLTLISWSLHGSRCPPTLPTVSGGVVVRDRPAPTQVALGIGCQQRAVVIKRCILMLSRKDKPQGAQGPEPLRMQWLGLGSYILAVCASCWPEWTHRCIKGALVAQPGDPKVVRGPQGVAACGRAGPLSSSQAGSGPVFWDPGRDRFRS